jgi:hypothetical protein
MGFSFSVILCLLAHCITVYGRSLLCYACLFLGRRSSYKHEEAARFGTWRSFGYVAQYNVFSRSLYNELLLQKPSNMAYGMG